MPINLIKNKYIHYIGRFLEEKPTDDKVQLYNHEVEEKENLKCRVTEKPVILIVGYGTDCDKFLTQLILLRDFKTKGVSVKNITYNPLGYVFDMTVYEYPKKIFYPDSVCSINRDIKKIDNENCDLIIANIGGGIRSLSKKNTNNYGALAEAFFDAVDVDIVMLCVNTFISPEIIKKDIIKMWDKGVSDVIVIVSNKTYSYSTLDIDFGADVYKV